MSKKVVLIWFRNDLRLHDNEVLTEAINKSDLIIPVYCFDPRYFSKNKFNQFHTGINRSKFLLETVSYLKEKLQSMNSDLMTFMGKPEEILPKLCAKYEVDEVYHHREVASRETSISEIVEAALWENKINLKHFIGHTLYHKEDLPFPIKDIPDKFNIFRKKIERESTVRPSLAAPEVIQSPQHLESTNLPSLEELGYSSAEIERVNTKSFSGGEKTGIQKLNTLLDPNYNNQENFTLISPYIAIGALSPIYTYHEMQNSALMQNKKRYDRLMTMLLWRDYFRFMLKKHPNVFFKINGSNSEINNTEDINESLVEKWKSANTGDEAVDYSIKTLLDTGNITYAERRLIAKYFVQELGSNWLDGAAFFEDHLLDFAPATTYGFWSHMAGVGTSTKENSTSDWQELAKRLYVPK